MRFFKDGGYRVTAAKVVKRASIKYKVEAAVLYSTVKYRYMYVVQNISRLSRQRVGRKLEIKLKNCRM